MRILKQSTLEEFIKKILQVTTFMHSHHQNHWIVQLLAVQLYFQKSDTVIYSMTDSPLQKILVFPNSFQPVVEQQHLNLPTSQANEF